MRFIGDANNAFQTGMLSVTNTVRHIAFTILPFVVLSAECSLVLMASSCSLMSMGIGYVNDRTQLAS